MFYNNRYRVFLKAVKKSTKPLRDFSSVQVPVFIRDKSGRFVKHYGRVGLAGFVFESRNLAPVGQRIDVRIVLLGLGVVVETSGKVVSVTPAGDHVDVAARFVAVSQEIEQTIARWLGLFANTSRVMAVA